MAKQAQTLVAGSGWLPEPPHRSGRDVMNVAEAEDIDTTDPRDDAAGEETAAGGSETAVVEDEEVTEDGSVAFEPHATAAE